MVGGQRGHAIAERFCVIKISFYQQWGPICGFPWWCCEVDMHDMIYVSKR
jgi:hypothetical protein